MLLNTVKRYFNGLIWSFKLRMYDTYMCIHDFFIMYSHTPPLPSLPLLKRAKNERI
jgi:hypothetical protein